VKTTNAFNNDTIAAYLDRRLDPATEEEFELALLADPDLAEQVKAEMALRRGFEHIRRTEGPQASMSGPLPAPSAVSAVAPVAARRSGFGRRRRWQAAAIAAAAALFAVVPTLLLVQQRDQQAAFEEALVARIEASGQQATYALPAAVFSPASATTGTEPAPDTDSPVRIRLPEGVSEVALEIPAQNVDVPRRLVLQRADQPGSRMDLDGIPLAGASAYEFNVGSDRLAPGKYLVTVEVLKDGVWTTERQMVLAVDAR
jgi:anti-sigma factor RsiW